MATTRTDTLTALVASEIRAWMGRRRVSGAQMARELHVSQMWVSDRLRGITPIDLNDLERIAAILDVDVLDLMPRRPSTVGDPTDRTRWLSAPATRSPDIPTPRPVTTRQAPPDNRPSGRAATTAPPPRTRRPARLSRPPAA